MPQTLYCWRCQIEVPMVTDEEWAHIGPHLSNASEQIKRYREITGFAETNPNALYHHRISNHGPACKACGKPLRTTKAKFCAACGTLKGE